MTGVIREVLTHPDPRLRRRCAPVGAVSQATRELACDLRETMYEHRARGLSAPEIGVLLRLFVVDAEAREDRAAMAFADPKVVAASRDVVIGPEHCLTVPDGIRHVARPRWVALRWTDLDGAQREGRFDGAWATCIQHEMDHLDGRLVHDHAGGDPA